MVAGFSQPAFQEILRESTLKGHSICMSANYRRCLPHWQPSEAPFFVTWRLHRSRPRCLGGPLWLIESHVASTVSLEILDSKHKDAIDRLFAWVGMPNHVQLLLRPKGELMPALQRIKGARCRKANRLLQLKG